MKNIPILILSFFIASSCNLLNHNKIRYIKSNNQKVKDAIKSNKIESTDYQDAIYRATDTNLTYSLKIEKINLNELKDQCDIMLLRSGEEILVKVVEIGVTEIKYKKCDNQQGPLFLVNKNDVFMITYENGSKDVFKIEEIKNNSNSISENKTKEIDKKNVNDNDKDKQTNGFAIVSLVLGILGIIPLAGIIFGVISLNQINEKPEKYKGKTMAILGIIFSLFWIFIILILLF